MRRHGTVCLIGSIAISAGCSLLMDPEDRQFAATQTSGSGGVGAAQGSAGTGGVDAAAGGGSGGTAAGGAGDGSDSGVACPVAAEPAYLKPRRIHRSAWFSAVLHADANTLVAIAPAEADRQPEPGVQNGEFKTNAGTWLDGQITGLGSIHFFERAGADWEERTFAVVRGVERTTAVVPTRVLWADMQSWLIAPAFSAQVLDHSAVVGLSGDFSTDEFRGSVRLFERGAAGWEEQAAPLEEPELAAGDLFGQSLALTADALFVGSPAAELHARGDDAGGVVENAGMVHVYRRDATGYHREASPKVSPFPNHHAVFGAAIAASEKWLIVGAPLEDSDAEDSQNPNKHGTPYPEGAVYAYPRSESGLGEPELVSPDKVEFTTFGASLALLGDTLVVGAPAAPGCGKELGYEQVGQVHVFRHRERWVHEGCVNGLQQWGLFGFSVALTESSVVVGAPWDEIAADTRHPTLLPNKPGSGAVFIFDRDHLDARPCVIKAPNADPDDSFGVSMTATSSSLFVGAPFEDSIGLGSKADPKDNGNLDTGALYVYDFLPRPAR